MASLEEEVRLLREAVEANTAAVLASGGGEAPSKPAAAKAGAKSGAAAKPAAAKKQKHNLEQVKAAITEVREKIDADSAREIIFKYAGDGAKMAALANFPDQFDAMMSDAQAKLAELEDGGDESEEDEGDL